MPKRRNRKYAAELKRLASERVERLFELAESEFKRHPEFADRYVRAAWRLKTRYNLKLPPEIKLKFCRKCLSFWSPGSSCRVRVRPRCVVITCLRCGQVKRLPFRVEKINNLSKPHLR